MSPESSLKNDWKLLSPADITGEVDSWRGGQVSANLCCRPHRWEPWHVSISQVNLEQNPPSPFSTVELGPPNTLFLCEGKPLLSKVPNPPLSLRLGLVRCPPEAISPA